MFVKKLFLALKRKVFYIVLLRLIYIYVYLSYRNNIKPKEKLLERWLGDRSFHFSTGHESLSIVTPSKLDLSIRMHSLELQKVPRTYSSVPSNVYVDKLSGSQFLIVISNLASKSRNLTELAWANKSLLESLGADCNVTTIEALQSQRYGFKQQLDFVIIDPFLTSIEIEFLFSLDIGIKQNSPNVRFVCHCYDLWRPNDEKIFRRLNPFVDIFLHADPIMVNMKFSDLKSKFFVWPIGRSWQNPSQVNVVKSKRSNSLYFSGSVTQLDRREILNAAIDITKSTNMKTHFIINDSRFSTLTPTIEKYFSTLTLNRCNLSPSQKSKEHWIIPGRAFDNLMTNGSGVLLQQEGSHCRPLKEFFTPYKDYLPFDSKEGLEELILWCDDNEHKVSEIAQNGNVKFHQIFSPTYFSEIFCDY